VDSQPPEIVPHPAPKQDSTTKPSTAGHSATPSPQILPAISASPKWPLRLAFIFGALTIICLGAGAVAFHFYDVATRTDRSTPAITLQSYLHAALQGNNDPEASKYICPGTNLVSITEFRNNAISIAKAHDATSGFDWTLGLIRTRGEYATASIDLEKDTMKQGSVVAASVSSWTFDLRDNGDGWRVCGARQVG